MKMMVLAGIGLTVLCWGMYGNVLHIGQDNFVDENGKPFASSKFIEVHFRDGKVVEMGHEFGLGRKGSHL